MRLIEHEKAYYVTGDGYLRECSLASGFNYISHCPEMRVFTTALEALLDGRDRVKTNLAALDAAIAEEVKK